MTSPRLLCAAVVILGTSWPMLLRSQDPPAPLPAYRARVLGVFNTTSGQAIEGAQVVDLSSRTSAVTSKTGTVSLAFLAEAENVVRIQKIGFQPLVMVITISPADTVPITALLNPVVQTLPTVVSRDSTRRHISPGLSAFEERRASNAGGRFITEMELRKSDNRKMTDVMRGAGVGVRCSTRPISCFAVSTRGGACSYNVYLDGMQVTGESRDLEKMQVVEYGGVEIYAGPATIPPMYNQTGSSCGVILLWTRERN